MSHPNAPTAGASGTPTSQPQPIDPGLTEALAECLEQLEAGTPLPAVLAAFPPAQRNELAVLAELSRAVGTLPAQPPRPAFRAHLQGELAVLEAERRRRRAWAGLPFGRRAWGARLAVLAGVLALILVGGVTAAASSLPGGLWDPIERIAAWIWPGTHPAREDSGAGVVPARPMDVNVPGTDQVNRRSGPAAPTAIHRLGRLDLWAVASELPGPDAGSPNANASAASAAILSAARPVSPLPVVAGAEPAAGQPAVATPTEDDRPVPDQPERDRDVPPTAAPASATPAASPLPTTTPIETPVSGGGSAGPSETPATRPSAPAPGPTLEAGVLSISGRVRRVDGSPDGAPLAEARVWLHRFGGAPSCADGPGPVAAERLTDTEGGYRFDGLPAGTYLIAASRPGGEGDPACLPLRWFVRGGPAVADFCAALPSAFALDDATPGRAWLNINVLFDETAGCGAP